MSMHERDREPGKDDDSKKPRVEEPKRSDYTRKDDEVPTTSTGPRTDKDERRDKCGH